MPMRRCVQHSYTHPPTLLPHQTGLTPLHQSALNGHVPVCTVLLEAGAAVDAQDEVCVCGGGVLIGLVLAACMCIRVWV